MLIKCSECGKDVSDRATSCPNCGNPITTAQVPIVKVVPARTTSLPKEDDTMRCPKCNSTQLTSNKKGFSVGKAAAGVLLTGGVGLLAGGIGSGKVNITCLKCGYKFKAGEYYKKKAEFAREKELLKKIRSGEADTTSATVLFIILSLIGTFISVSLFSHGWNFLGVVFSVVTILCIIMVVFTVQDQRDTKKIRERKAEREVTKEIGAHENN